MALLCIQNFVELVEKCRRIEDLKNRRKKSMVNPSVGGPNRFGKVNHQNRGKQVAKPYDRPQENRGAPPALKRNYFVSRDKGNGVAQVCYRCGKEGHYAKACTAKSRVCYNCGQPGHYSRECQKPKVEPTVNQAKVTRPLAKGRVYCMTSSGTRRNNNLIEEMCEIAGTTLMALIDLGATHSFIYLELANKLKLKVSQMPFDLQVSTPAKNLVVDSSYPEERVFGQPYMFPCSVT